MIFENLQAALIKKNPDVSEEEVMQKIIYICNRVNSYKVEKPCVINLDPLKVFRRRNKPTKPRSETTLVKSKDDSVTPNIGSSDHAYVKSSSVNAEHDYVNPSPYVKPNLVSSEHNYVNPSNENSEKAYVAPSFSVNKALKPMLKNIEQKYEEHSR